MLAAHIAALGELCTRLCERLRVKDGGGQPGRAGPGCGGRWGCAAGLPASLLAAEDGREKSHLGCVCVHEGALYAQLRKPLCLLLILRIPPPPQSAPEARCWDRAAHLCRPLSVPPLISPLPQPWAAFPGGERRKEARDGSRGQFGGLIREEHKSEEPASAVLPSSLSH